MPEIKPPIPGPDASAARLLMQEASRTLWRWVTQVERKKALNGLAATVGGAFLVSYYQSLDTSFMPSVDLGQALLLLMQAFLLGILLTAFLCVCLFGPAFVFHVCAPRQQPDAAALPRPLRRRLLVRHLAAQVLGMSLCVVLSIVLDDPAVSPSWRIDFNACALAAEICLVVLLFCRPVATHGYTESAARHLRAIVLLMGVAGVAFWLVWTLLQARDASQTQRWTLYLSSLGLALLSSRLGVAGRQHLRLAIPAALALLLVLLINLQSGSLPARVLASVLGIAEKEPVTLFLPPQTCELVAQAMTSNRALDCDDKTGGMLSNVWLRNQLGTRWIIQEDIGSQSISFDSRGVAVRAPRRRR